MLVRFNPLGELLCKSDGDAPSLSLGCKLQILVSLRVFGMESHYICTFGYRLSLTAVHKETMVSLQAFLSFLSRAHPNCPLPLLTPAAQASPSMVSFIF